MARILGIDCGRRRTGLAVTDPLKIVAGAIGTFPSHSVLQFIKDYVAREEVELFVVGMPTQLNGEPSESMRYITPFVNSLRKQLPHIPVVMYDERFTSAIAHQAMLDGGMKKSDRRDKGRVDSIAATIILNDFLNSRNNLSQGNGNNKT